MHTTFQQYPELPGQKTIHKELERITRRAANEYLADDNLRKVFGLIDLTSLNASDTETTVRQLCEKVNQFHRKPGHIGIPNVAAICVYPNFVPVVKEHLHSRYVKIAAVAAGFPASQTFPEIKQQEIEMAVAAGANEIDLVLSVGDLIQGHFQKVYDELKFYISVAKPAHVKVILEVGALDNPQTIYKGAILAMEAGADFIKTSTGKGYPAANPEAAWIMAYAIQQYYKQQQRMVGLKPAGGISQPEDALIYLALVDQVLGKQWITKEWFRIGASRLANRLLHKVVKHFHAQDEGYF